MICVHMNTNVQTHIHAGYKKKIKLNIREDPGTGNDS